jgi:hypothetical protein
MRTAPHLAVQGPGTVQQEEGIVRRTWSSLSRWFQRRSPPQVQHYAIEHSRLGIPIIYGVDAVHGFGHPTAATLFPQSIGMGATWDTALAYQAGAATRDQVCSTGTVWDFAPVQDPARDNRWGRYYETWGEEPALTAALGGANIAGMQSGDCPSDPGLRVASTVKHFAGYSESINSHDRVEEQLPIRTCRTSSCLRMRAGSMRAPIPSGQLRVDQRRSSDGIPFPADDRAAAAAGLHGRGDQRPRRGLRPADGVPHRSRYRDCGGRRGQRGCGHGDELAILHQFRCRAACGRPRWARPDVADRPAVSRILALKFKLGLLDHPYVDPAAADGAVTSNQKLARQAADE